MKNIDFENIASFRLPPKLQQERVNRVIREMLSQDQREVLVAYYFQQKKIPQIAAERGVHKSTVMRTLHRAEANLKRYLKY